MNIDTLVESAQKSTSRSSRDVVLSAEVRSDLDAFVDFLMKVENKTEATARSYRSYVVSALISNVEFEMLSSDIKSGARAFARYQNSK